MEAIDKVQEYIDEVKALRQTPELVSPKEAAVIMDCSTRTVRRWARVINARIMQSSGKYYYFLYDVRKMILRREYKHEIRRFNKLYKDGFYAKK